MSLDKELTEEFRNQANMSDDFLSLLTGQDALTRRVYGTLSKSTTTTGNIAASKDAKQEEDHKRRLRESIADAARENIAGISQTADFLLRDQKEKLAETQGFIDYGTDITRTALQENELLRRIMTEQGYDIEGHIEKGYIPDEVKAAYEEEALITTAYMSESDAEGLTLDMRTRDQEIERTQRYIEQFENGDIKLEDLPDDIKSKIEDPMVQYRAAQDQHLQQTLDKYGVTYEQLQNNEIDSPTMELIGQDMKAWENENYSRYSELKQENELPDNTSRTGTSNASAGYEDRAPGLTAAFSPAAEGEVTPKPEPPKPEPQQPAYAAQQANTMG